MQPVVRDAEGAAALTSDNDDLLQHLKPEERKAVEDRELALHEILALAYNDLATAHAVQKEYNQALEYYQQAGHWKPDLPGLAKNLGFCAYRAKNFEQAVPALHKALEDAPTSTGLHAMLGLSYFALDKYAEAIKAFEPLGERGMRDGEIGYAWAASLTHLSDLGKASEVLTAFESAGQTDQALLLAGQLWTEIGDFAHAQATLQNVLDHDASTPRAHFYRGLADIHWEHWNDAAKEFQAELAISPSDPDALYHLGFVQHQLNNIDQALALYMQVIAAHPDYTNAQYEAGKILLDRNQFEDAAAHLEIAARLAPQKDYIHYQLQAAYRKLGRVADADRELEIYKGLKAKSRERVADALQKKMQ